MADKAKQEAVADSCFSDLTFANFIYSFGCMSIFNGFYKKIVQFAVLSGSNKLN